MFKKFFLLFCMLLLIFLFSSKAEALNYKNISVIDNGIITNFSTDSETVKEFFTQNNIFISKNDFVNKKMNEQIFNGMNIEIERPFILKVLVDDKEKIFNVKFNDTVSDFLKVLQKEFDKEFTCTEDNNFKLRNCHELKFYSQRTELVEKTEIIPFETKIIYSDKLLENVEQILQNGINGEKLITEEIIFSGNDEISRTKNETIIKKPIEKIITKGTCKNVLIMNASAYTAGFESTGKRPGDKGYGITATGAKARHGIVAVDPKVIPLGSKLFIEGYGYATALDTGGAIKGNKIDLFYESLYDAKKFGRRQVKVHILS